MLSQPPVLSKQAQGLPLLVYLTASPEAVSVTIVLGTTDQKSIYFVSRVLQDVETRYQMIENVSLALVHAKVTKLSCEPTAPLVRCCENLSWEEE